MTNLRRDIETYTCGEVPAMADAPRLEKWSVEIARKKKHVQFNRNGQLHRQRVFPQHAVEHDLRPVQRHQA